MKLQSSRIGILLVGGSAAVASAFAGSVQAESLGELLKRATQKMEKAVDKAVDKVDRATQKADSVVSSAERKVAKVQAQVDNARETLLDINDQVVRANQYVDRLAQAANAVNLQGRMLAEDSAAAEQFVGSLTDLLRAHVNDPVNSLARNAIALPDVPAPTTAAVPAADIAALDGLFESAPAAPTMRVVKQGPLQGLPIRLGHFAFEEQVLEASVDVGAAARGLGTAPAVLDDAALLTWLQSGEAQGTIFAFRVASTPEQLGELSAAAKSGALIADLMCDVIEVSHADGSKSLIVRPTHVEVRLSAAATPAAGM